MNYDEAVKFLERTDPLAIDLGLDRVLDLLSLLGSPHKKFRSILIAGTNGKGSVAAMLDAVLLEAGFSTGLYTSPHLIDHTERIRISGNDISRERFAASIGRIKDCIDQNRGSFKKLTVFEILTAAAFLEFSRSNVDIAVLEVGLGGRLDATNVVTPEVSVVTNVGLDHTEILGDDTQKIAFEKSGVIRDGVPFVTAARGDALKLLVNTANETHAPLYFVRDLDLDGGLPLAADYVSLIKSETCLGKETASIRGKYEEYKDLEIPLAGRHQAVNLSVVIGVTDALKDKGFKIDDGALRRGLKKTRWSGRFEVVSDDPLVILDGAHNPDGARALAQTLERAKIKRPLTLVLGVLSNKDIKGVLGFLAPLADTMIAARSCHPKSAPPQKIKAEAETYPVKVLTADSVADALDLALSFGRDQTICFTGSLFVAADARRLFSPDRF